jgi:hypothetical protein
MLCRRFVLRPAVAVFAFIASLPAGAILLHDNGTVFDAPGAGFGGADLSQLISPNTTSGFRVYTSIPTITRSCDDLPLFAQPAVVQQVQFYGHTDPGETPIFPTMTIEFRGGTATNPNLGSLSTNVDVTPYEVVQVGYRASSTQPLNADRKVYRVSYNVTPFQIQANTKYWIAWTWTGDTSLPTNIPRNLPVVPTPGGGNARTISSSAAITPMVDAGSQRNVEVTFKVFGENGNRVSGTVDLQDWTAGLDGNKIEISLIQNNVVVETIRPTMNAAGKFEAVTTLSGTYDIRIKRTHWLSRLFKARVLGSTSTNLTASLINGDCDKSDYIGTDDYLILSASFDLHSGDTGFEPGADLDGDNYVGTDDYLILNKNFDLGGE